MIYTPVSKALKSANDNSRTRVAACSLRNAKRYLLFQARLLACVSSSHTHLPNQSDLVCQLDIKQWVPDHADFHVFFFFCFVLFSSGKRRPLMMVRSSALWKWTGESTMERDRTWRLLKLQLPSLLLKGWKRNTLQCTRKSKSQSGLGGHQCCGKGAFLDFYCWDNAVEHCYSNRKKISYVPMIIFVHYLPQWTSLSRSHVYVGDLPWMNGRHLQLLCVTNVP